MSDLVGNPKDRISLDPAHVDLLRLTDYLETGNSGCKTSNVMRENMSSGLLIESNISRAVQPQKMARGLKLRILEEKGS